MARRGQWLSVADCVVRHFASGCPTVAAVLSPVTVDDGPPSSYNSGQGRASLFRRLGAARGRFVDAAALEYYMRSLNGCQKTPECSHCILWPDESCSLVCTAALPRQVIFTLDAQLRAALIRRAGCRARVLIELDSSTSELSSVLALGAIRPLGTGATPA